MARHTMHVSHVHGQAGFSMLGDQAPYLRRHVGVQLTGFDQVSKGLLHGADHGSLEGVRGDLLLVLPERRGSYRCGGSAAVPRRSGRAWRPGRRSPDCESAGIHCPREFEDGAAGGRAVTRAMERSRQSNALASSVLIKYRLSK